MNNTTLVEAEQISDDIRWGLLERKAQEAKVSKAFQLFRSAGIEPILIKGLAVANFYPTNRPRISIDMDLAVSAEDFVLADSISQSPKADGLAIDLHRELRHLDTVPWQDLLNNSEVVETENGSYRVLRSEDHLRVLCVHWLTDGGSNKDRLWDIYYLVANRQPTFDWDRFLLVVSKRRQRWLICTIGLAHKYLGLDLSETPLKDTVRDLPDWLTKTVENEWANDIKAIPLEVTLRDRSIFLEQILNRLKPNPIWATVQMEGSFDAKTRFFYKIGNTLKRIIPSIRRISKTIWLNYK